MHFRKTVRFNAKKSSEVTALKSVLLILLAAVIALSLASCKKKEKAVKENKLIPMAEIIATAQAGVDPSVMGLGPVPAIGKVLQKAGMTLQDIDVLELNEAFAAQSLGVIAHLKQEHGVDDNWFEDHCNVNGGAIALGHPIGASGNRITVSLIYEMKRRNARYGLASLCIGGGMGTAVILKKV